MASQGCRFIEKMSFGYLFAADKPANVIIKIDYRTFRIQVDFEDYRTLFEVSGWEHISGTRSSGYQYFKKAGSQGSDEIFSDIDSKAARYKRLSDMWAALAFSLIPVLAAILTTEAITLEKLFDPMSLFYTRGLWEKNGLDFWKAILFETSFALFRVLFLLVIPVSILLYLYFAFKAHQHYKEMQDNN